MQGTQVPSLVREVRFHETVKPMESPSTATEILHVATKTLYSQINLLVFILLFFFFLKAS